MRNCVGEGTPGGDSWRPEPCSPSRSPVRVRGRIASSPDTGGGPQRIDALRLLWEGCRRHLVRGGGNLSAGRRPTGAVNTRDPFGIADPSLASAAARVPRVVVTEGPGRRSELRLAQGRARTTPVPPPWCGSAAQARGRAGGSNRRCGSNRGRGDRQDPSCRSGAPCNAGRAASALTGGCAPAAWGPRRAEAMDRLPHGGRVRRSTWNSGPGRAARLQRPEVATCSTWNVPPAGLGANASPVRAAMLVGRGVILAGP